MQVTAQYAREHFDELLAASDIGEPVEIQRDGKAAYRLTPIASSHTGAEARQTRRWGLARGQIWMAPDWDSPEVNDAISAEFEASKIFPSDDSE